MIQWTGLHVRQNPVCLLHPLGIQIKIILKMASTHKQYIPVTVNIRCIDRHVWIVNFPNCPLFPPPDPILIPFPFIDSLESTLITVCLTHKLLLDCTCRTTMQKHKYTRCHLHPSSISLMQVLLPFCSNSVYLHVICKVHGPLFYLTFVCFLN